MRLEATEFIRRFLLHALPKGFVRIRRYGLMANAQRESKLALCRELLGHRPDRDPVSTTCPEIQPYEPRIWRCLSCSKGVMQRLQGPISWSAFRPRAPPIPVPPG